MKKFYQFSFSSPSGGHRGFSTFETVAEAQRERTRLARKGYKVGMLQTILR